MQTLLLQGKGVQMLKLKTENCVQNWLFSVKLMVFPAICFLEKLQKIPEICLPDFSPRFRSASFSISAGNGFTPAPTPEESLSSALNEEDDMLGNPDFDPEQYNSSDVPSSTTKKEEELLRKMGLK